MIVAAEDQRWPPDAGCPNVGLQYSVFPIIHFSQKQAFILAARGPVPSQQLKIILTGVML